MDKDFYRDKLIVSDHLNSETYCIADKDNETKVLKGLKNLTEKHQTCLTKKELKYITKNDYQPSNFYALPKIHKNKTIIEAMEKSNDTYIHLEAPHDLKARPIVAGPNCPTSRLSALIEKVLSPLVPLLDSYIKDDWDLLRKLPHEVICLCDLFSFDIVSLYTNIDHDLGIKALNYWITRNRQLVQRRFTNEFILEAALFILTNNYFLFDDIYYHQLIGTAIGTKFAPTICLSGYRLLRRDYPLPRNHHLLYSRAI